MIAIHNLHVTLGKTAVLKGINLEVPKGEVVVIIGPSGSGKSTLLRCLNALETPTQGQVFLEGQDIHGASVQKTFLGSKVGMVFQQFNLFPHQTVLENLMFAPQKVQKKSKEYSESKALELLKKVGLEDKAHSYPSQLSGGQKQRVAIARCLAMDPELILFDEPTSALDPEMVKEVLEVIKGLAGTGITMAIVTHEMNFAKEVANRLLFLDQGIILEDSPPRSFFERPQTERAQEFLNKIL